MKKINLVITAAIILAGACACNSLDLEPKGILAENTLFGSEYGVKKYFAGIYNDLPIEDFNYKSAGDGKGYAVQGSKGYHPGNFWESQKGWGGVRAAECGGRGNDDENADNFEYWPYDRIREVNTFLENFPSYKDNFTAARYTELMGEGHFLRAFYYFGMAKRYGGVPLVKNVLNPTMPSESITLPRSTEYETWKFIHDDLAIAMADMTSDKSNPGRANKYAAAALMAKAMLYAGSVAKYNTYTGVTGPATDAGLMGMETTDAKEFFQYAYDACKFIENGGYSLHESNPDKVQNFVEIFTQENPGDEDIFIKRFGPQAMRTTLDGMSLNHCWDAMVLPLGTGMSSSVGCAIHPLWDLVSLFQLPAVVDENGKPVRFNSLSDIWNNDEMEARCKADFFFPGMTEPVSGTVLDIQAGYYKSFPGTAADGIPDSSGNNDYTDQYRVRQNDAGKSDSNGKITGVHGCQRGGDEGYSTSGILLRKYVDTDPASRPANLFTSSSPWKVFRYGEILITLAEAAYELYLEDPAKTDLRNEAFSAINKIRARAGARNHQFTTTPSMVIDAGYEREYPYEIDENLLYIRQERARELCFEGHANWDQRRWRVAHELYQFYFPKNLLGYKVLDENKYIYLNELEAFGRSITYNKQYYYEQIPGSKINQNKLLIRNDGY